MMFVGWVAFVVVLILALAAVPTGRTISTASWPTETPLSLHDNRARDPHLRHLARILGSDVPAEAQRALAALVDGVVTSHAVMLAGGEAAARARLGDGVRIAVEESAPDHARFLRRVSAALDEIERL